jgi:hypothetical protein
LPLRSSSGQRQREGAECEAKQPSEATFKSAEGAANAMLSRTLSRFPDLKVSHLRASSATAPCLPDAGADANNDGQTRDLPGSNAIHLRVMCSSTPAMSRIATLHMLRSAISNSLSSRDFRLNHTPHATAVYASCSALPPPHARLASRRPAMALPGPGLHRLDRASFAWRLPLIRSPRPATREPQANPASFRGRE